MHEKLKTLSRAKLTRLQSTYNSFKESKDSPNSGQVLKLLYLRDLDNNISDAFSNGNHMVNTCTKKGQMYSNRLTKGHTVLQRQTNG